MPSKERRITLMFSATFPPQIQKLASTFLRDYVWVAVGRVGSTVDSITQNLVESTSNKVRSYFLSSDCFLKYYLLSRNNRSLYIQFNSIIS